MLPKIKNLIGKAMISDTKTILGCEPLTHICVKSKTGHSKERKSTSITGVETIVQADATADKPVVAESVGLVRTTHNVSVGVTICILLSETADGEQEACCCKSSKDFHTFHNRLL